jgi:serine/threonine-protein kinase
MQGSNFDLAPQDWALLRGLLDMALDLPTAERQAWVDRLDARHAGLKPRLRALLAHAQSPVVESLLDTLPKVETGQFAPRPPSGAGEEPGGLIGVYRLIRPLGEGGMASVWLAERTDVLQKRRVALKLPHGAWRRAGLAERLAREREILATLEHPHIARLYDAGVTPQGQPYLALEYVEGLPIDDFCRSHALGVRQRLDLLLQVCGAVALAHARLVVHRDLKPSNILVDAAGQVRLLDFGIAKLMAGDATAETQLTREAGRPLTPDYAAPEQIRGEPLGTAADIYSLGVVLFELLAGRRPYRLKHGSRLALEPAILQAEVPRPSDATADPARRRELCGDLDTIVLKALKPAPEERYQTVNALADDLRRHLSHQPVLARADGRAYRLRKFLLRNRLAVSAGAAIGLALTLGAGVAAWQAGEARAQRDAALVAMARADERATAARRAERVAEAQSDLASYLLSDFANDRSQQQMVEQLERAVITVQAQYPDDGPLRGRMLLDVAARMGWISNFARANALMAEAEPLLRNDADPGSLARLLCLRARDAAFDGAVPRAAALLAEAQALLQSPSLASPLRVRAACLIEAAAVARIQGDMPGAIAAALQARQLEERAGQTHNEDHAETLNSLGRAYFQAGRYRETVATMRASIALRERIGRGQTPGAMNARTSLAMALREGGRPLDALAAHEAVRSGAAGREQNTGPRSLHYATTLAALGRHEEALAALAPLLVDARTRDDRTEVRAIMVLRSQVHIEIGALGQAQAGVQEAERLYADLLAKRRYTARQALFARARLALAQRDAAAAQAALQQAREIVQATGYAEDPAWRQVHHLEGRLALLRGDAQSAGTSAAAALAIAQRQAIDADASLAVAEELLLLAQARSALGDAAGARADAARAAQHAQAAAGAGHPVTRRALAMAA